MTTHLNDFLGSWTVAWLDGLRPWLAKGWRIEIGTGIAGSKPPFFTDGYQACVGFAVLDSAGQSMLTGDGTGVSNEPMALLYTGDQLRWTGTVDQTGKVEPLRIVIAASIVETLDDQRFVSIFGSTTWGDPDQVAVWGADGNAPPPSP